MQSGNTEIIKRHKYVGISHDTQAIFLGQKSKLFRNVNPHRDCGGSAEIKQYLAIFSHLFSSTVYIADFLNETTSRKDSEQKFPKAFILFLSFFVVSWCTYLHKKKEND